MGINDSTRVFSSDILWLELSGPEQPHLILVDLLDYSKPAAVHNLMRTVTQSSLLSSHI
ncbi:hypothetical protein GQ44DRAFT_819733 [Phaeosphaeriaceae sp. PMI808]|nr:hypothetical protein GQ44DRAFT_819733 [Phaeosphaeriaceae sp. PMI808]